jgi:hypothetical protein
MAEKSLVYRINFDGLEAQAAAIGKVDNELTTLNQTIKKNRADLVNLTELNDQGTAKYRDLTDELGRNIVQQRNLTKAKGDLIRETQNEAKVLKENEGSIVSLRAQLSNLTKEYNNLTKAERESAKGKDVQNQAKAISDELKKLESAVGNTSRNVGNYKEALGELETSLKQLLQAQAAARKSGQENNAVFVANEAAIQALAQEYQVLAQSEKEVDNQLKALTSTENEAGASADSLKSKLRALKEAAAVAGEGTEDFKRLTAEAGKLQDKIEDANEAIKQEKGTEFEKFREQLGGVGQSLGNLDFKQANERIAQLGGTLKGLTFSSLKDGLKGATSSFAAFGKVLLSNPIFLFAAVVAAVGIALFALKDKVKIIGDAFDAIGSTINGVIQGVKNFSDAIGLTSFKADAAAKKLSEDALKRYNADKLAFEQANEDKIRAIEREIAIQQSLGKDVTDLEIEKRKQIQLSLQEELKRTEALIKIKGLINANTAEETKRLREIGIELDKLDTEITVIENNRTAKQKDANDKKLADQKKYNKDRIKNENDADNELLKLQQQQDLSEITNEFDKVRKIAEIDFTAEKKRIEALDISNEKKLQLLEVYSQRYLAIINKTNKDEQELTSGPTTIGVRNPTVNKPDALKNIINEEIGNLKPSEAEIPQIRKTPEELEAERIAEIQKNADTAAITLEIASNTINTLAQLKDMETEQNIARINRERDAQIAAVQESTLSEEAKAKKIAEINKQAEAKAEAERKKNAESQKRFALIQIALDTGKAIAAAISAGAAAGPPPANLIAIASGIAAVLSGIVSATAAVNAAKFALGGEIPMDGGFITGNSHANGGVKFSAGGRLMEAEGGEIIVNKGIQKRPDFVRAISQMNYMTGGKKFETGGIVAPVFSAAGASLAASEQSLGGGFTFEIPPIQVLNNVVDTTSQQSSIIQIQNQTSIGG